MNKLISLSLALLLALSLMACGGQNNSRVETNDSTNSVTTETPTQPESEQTEPEQKKDEETPSTSEESATKPSDGESEDKDQSESEEEQPAKDAIAFSASHTDVTFKAVGSSFQLVPQGNRDEYTASYSSADESIATVDSDGNVTAVAPGTTTITMHVEVPNRDAKVEYEFTCIVRCNWVVESEEEEETEQETPSETPAAGVDLAAFFASYMESLGESAPFMMPVEGEILDVYYPGLNGITCKQSVVQMAAMSAVPFEFVLIEVENTGDVEAVKAILQARVTYQAEGGAWYPETIEAWEKAEVIVSGNYVAMIVAGEQQSAAVAAFNALFN